MSELKKEKIKSSVRDVYKKIAIDNANSCCGPNVSCCGTAQVSSDSSLKIGYSKEEVSIVPEGANMGLGCGNPNAIASLKEGEVVLDLGSGGGFDCFLASKQVGDKGSVIGIDMTPEMISKARENAEKSNYKNVDFRLGEIENIPAANESIDVVMSNCVINLSPDKNRVFSEVFRVLKNGGRIAISDIVAKQEIPEELKDDLGLYAGCMAGAETIDKIKSILKEIGFKDIKITTREELSGVINSWAPESEMDHYVVSAQIEAWK